MKTLDSADAFERSVYRKVTWHVVPLLMLAYAAAFVVRVNIGLAKLQMLGDLHFSEAVYGLGAGIFFVGYFLFELPSNLLLHKFGARRSIARIMIVWGFISASMMFVSSANLFYLLRFLLGIAEAGFFPGVILYLTYWYPAKRRARTLALFMTSVPFSGLIGSPISGWILRHMTGWHGLAGWKWLFLLEALPSIVIGVLVLFVLKDGIDKATWLDDREKALLHERLRVEEESKKCSSTRDALRNPYIWVLTAIYFFLSTGTNSLGFWLPTLVQAGGSKDLFRIGLWTSIPYIFAVGAMVLLSQSSDRTGKRRSHAAGASLAAALALAASAHLTGHFELTLLCLTIATAGCFAAIPLFWTMPTALLTDTGAAAGIALINSLGNLSTFPSQSLMGWLAVVTHGVRGPTSVMVGAAAIAAVLTLTMPARLVDK